MGPALVEQIDLAADQRIEGVILRIAARRVDGETKGLATGEGIRFIEFRIHLRPAAHQTDPGIGRRCPQRVERQRITAAVEIARAAARRDSAIALQQRRREDIIDIARNAGIAGSEVE